MTDTEAGTVADLARKAAGVAQVIDGPNDRKFMVLPSGMSSTEIINPDGLKSAFPRYVSQRVTLQRVDSLIDYVNRFKRVNSVLFADIVQNSITAVLDYHLPPPAEPDAAPAGRHCVHRATMALPFSEEWTLWTGIDKKLVGQLEFARFIEENAPDIKAPAAGELLDAVRDLQANRKVSFIKAVRTASDNEDFEYTVENEAKTKGSIELPTQFVLSIPVYFGEPDIELRAFLRWKIDPEGGGLSLGIQLTRKEYVRQAEFQKIAVMVQEKIGLTVVYGKDSA